METEKKNKKPPNVIWFIVDQMRGQALGANGDPNVFTPNLDNMAIAGTNFPRAVSGYPLCGPFRGSMLTGKYAHNHSVKLHEDRLDPSFATVADMFNDNGYDTVYLGKWHVAGIKEKTGRAALQTVPREDRGRFKTWLGYDNNNSQWDCYLHGHDGDNEIPRFRLNGYEADCLTQMALERIAGRTDSDPPFFMVISLQPPHDPNLAPAEHRRYQAQQLALRQNVPETFEAEARLRLSGYYAQIENIDTNLGRLLRGLRETNLRPDTSSTANHELMPTQRLALPRNSPTHSDATIGESCATERSNQLDNTHVLFFSDHGDQMGSHGRFGKCVPYEESARVPFLIGGGIPMDYDGLKCGNAPCLINHVDIIPTTLGLCGLDAPDGLEGFDYSHRRTGKDFKRRVEAEPDSAYLQLIGDRESGYAWRCVVTRDGWKYACVKNGDWLLFDLKKDPYEQNNLAFHSGFRWKRNEMNSLIREWAEKTGDQFAFPCA